MNELSDFINIFSSLIPAISSLFFIILLMVTYYTQVRFSSMKSKLYRLLLINVLAILILEIITSFSFYYSNYPIVYNIFLRVTWASGITWFLLLFLYSISFAKNIDAKNAKELFKTSKLCLFYFIFSIIVFIEYFFVPIESKITPLKDFSYIPGTAAIFVMAYCGLTTILILLIMFINFKKVEMRKKVAILLMIIEIVIMFIIQVLFDNIIFLSLGAAIQMYFLYFNIENPDLTMIKELEKVKTNIENSNKAKSDFLSNMSHEIRTPMNAIVGFSDTLLNNTNFDPVSARSDIKHIRSAGNNLLDIINNILDISKIESGDEELQLKKYSIKNLIMELAGIIEPRLSGRNIKLVLNIDENIPSVLYGDSTKLFQVLLNILTNAAKYTEVGKIALSINGEKNGVYEKLRIKVADTGFGIKKEDYDKMFEKFSRLDTAKTNEIEGTGLGLVITKKYIDLMNGKIWFESEYGVGTTFYVEVDQKIISETSIGNVKEESNDFKNVEDLDCSGCKVLVVDDNKLNLKVASKILSKFNIEVETLESAKEAINKIKAEEHYDMIFFDHMMPEMDGIEAIHILRKLDGYKLPPIVVLTANAITGMKEMYIKEGFDEYLSKPINVGELGKILKKYLKKDGDNNEKDN